MHAEHKRDALLRLKTVRGHLDGVIRMVEAEAYCPDLMKQVAAAQASLERVNRVSAAEPSRNLRDRSDPEPAAAAAKIAELIDALRFNGSLTDFRERAEPLASSSHSIPPKPTDKADTAR